MTDLSVIIPVYNGERFIAQAIDSVLAQTHVGMEIIIVNDGSTDDTLHVLDEYASQVTVYTIEHAGASEARNYGLRSAHGEYVMFLDADDYLMENDICWKCVERAKSEELEMVMFSFRYLNNVTNRLVDAYTYNEKLLQIKDSDLLIQTMIETGAFPASPCFKVINREFLLLHNLLFRGQMIAEDVEWFVRLLIAVNRFGLLNDPAYVYRKNVPGSVTFTMNSEKCRHFFRMIKEAIKSIDEVDVDKKRHALYGSMAYEYCILIGNANNVSEHRQMESDLKSLSWLLEYDSFPRIKWARRLFRMAGYRITAGLFGFYIRNFSRSMQ